MIIELELNKMVAKNITHLSKKCYDIFTIMLFVSEFLWDM
jgi:hypothetical protein